MFKRNEIRFHKVLSNGQVASFYAITKDVHEHKDRAWELGFIVSASRTLNNKWFLGKTKTSMCISTGTCGLEALLYAKQCIAMLEDLLYVGDYVVIDAADDRRASAYMYMQRMGYSKGMHHDECVLIKRMV